MKDCISNIRIFEYKSRIINKCLNDIFDFITNQSFNTTPDMKFGAINPQRQKVLIKKSLKIKRFFQLLKELYYIEILFQILRIITNHKDLEKFKKINKNRSPQSQSPARKRFKSSLGRTNLEFEDSFVSRNEESMFFRIMTTKETIVSLIYKILGKMCEKNLTNSSYIFNYVSFMFYQVIFSISIKKNSSLDSIFTFSSRFFDYFGVE